MEKRFRVLLADQGGDVKWEAVFDESQEMPGHQKKYQHILDRTFLRPRDVIRFCNTILEQFKARKLSTGLASQRFENSDVHGARVEYSDYFIRELDDEIHKHVPNYRDYLEILRSNGTWHFERNRFEEEFRARYPTDDSGPGAALQHLFTFSIIGFYRPGGGGYGGSEYVFRYKEPISRFDPTAARFRVHPGLIEYLGLKRV
jgi:hypothetical protein